MRKVNLGQHGRRTGGILSWLVLLFALTVIIRLSMIQTFKIPSASMEPTLLIGDHIVVNKMAYGFLGNTWRPLPFQRVPKKEDIVVFSRFSPYETKDPETHYIKRIVGAPGDTIEVKSGVTMINGIAVSRVEQKSGAAQPNSGDIGPMQLAADEYFVLGENSTESKDSRFFGPINLTDIEGRAEVVYWSWDYTGPQPRIRWERVGVGIR